MHDVFISYSSKDWEQACAVRACLVNRGITCWMAPESIPGGSNYTKEIPVGIRGCRVFVLLLSQNALRSPWVLRELDSAVNNEKCIIPYLLDDCRLTDEFEFLLSGCQWHSARTPNAQGALADRILTIVQKMSQAPGYPRDYAPSGGHGGGYREVPTGSAGKKWIVAVTALCLAVLLGIFGGYQLTKNTSEEKRTAYTAAERLLQEQDYDGAIAAFRALGNYRDASSRADELTQLQKKYDAALVLLNDRQFQEAIDAFQDLGDYRDSQQYVQYEVPYQMAADFLTQAGELEGGAAQAQYILAAEIFEALGTYRDSAEQKSHSWLGYALIELESGSYESAMGYMDALTGEDTAALRGAYVALCADELFPEDAVTALVTWWDAGEEYTLKEELELALAILEPYESTYFDDPAMADLMEDFRYALEIMDNSVSEGDTFSCKSQFYLGAYHLFTFADALEEAYGVLSVNEGLRSLFVGRSGPYYQRYVLEASFENWWNGVKAVQMDDGHFYATYTNDTGYTFDLLASVRFLDENENVLELGETMTIHVDQGATVQIPTIPVTISDEEWSKWSMTWAFENVS